MNKIFSKTTFPQFYFLFYFCHSWVPRWVFIPYFSKIWSFRKWFSVRKQRGPKNDFSILFSLLCTITDKRTNQKHFPWKTFSWTIFFLNWRFFTFFLNNLLEKFYRTIQNTVFLKINLYNQKNYSENCFSFFSIGTLYSQW